MNTPEERKAYIMHQLHAVRPPSQDPGHAAVAALVALARDLRLPVAAVKSAADVAALDARIRTAISGRVPDYTEPGILIGKLMGQLQRAVDATEAQNHAARQLLARLNSDAESVFEDTDR